jgi:hypothetical protein
VDRVDAVPSAVAYEHGPIDRLRSSRNGPGSWQCHRDSSTALRWPFAAVNDNVNLPVVCQGEHLVALAVAQQHVPVRRDGQSTVPKLLRVRESQNRSRGYIEAPDAGTWPASPLCDEKAARRLMEGKARGLTEAGVLGGSVGSALHPWLAGHRGDHALAVYPAAGRRGGERDVKAGVANGARALTPHLLITWFMVSAT